MNREKQNIEYKSTWRDEYLKWICGFANANGGRLIIGVSDDKKVVGLANVDKLMEDIPNKIVDCLGIVADVNLLAADGLEYIEIIVSPSNIPVSYKGEYHYRSGSTKQVLKGVALQNFILKKMGHSWDDFPLETATIEDIDRNAIDYFLRKSIAAGRMDDDERNASTENVLMNLGLITNDGKLKNAAILLFGKNVRQFFPAAEFKIGRFHSDESDLITQDVIDGNLIQMPGKIVEILRSKYLISPIHYEGLQRVETLEIPEMALRELLYNSISHKDYTGPAIQMRVYDNHIELWNYGLLPAEITPENLIQTHTSHPRNNNIAHVFFKAGFVESWGRGFKKIYEEFSRVDLPMPEIKEVNGGVNAIIRRRTIEDIIAERSGGLNGESGGLNGESGGINGGNGGKSGGKVTVMELTNRQRLIISFICKRTDISARDMAVMTDIPQRTIERELAVMQRSGIIKHVGAKKTGSWIICIPLNPSNVSNADTVNPTVPKPTEE